MKVEFPNDSIASNKSQVSVHDNEPGNDIITNACFDLDFDDDDENETMICDIVEEPTDTFKNRPETI